MGLVPFWLKPAQLAKQPYSTINARAETIRTAPTYREPFKTKHCLVPSTGWYEWQKIDAKKKRPIQRSFGPCPVGPFVCSTPDFSPVIARGFFFVDDVVRRAALGGEDEQKSDTCHQPRWVMKCRTKTEGDQASRLGSDLPDKEALDWLSRAS